MNTLPSVEQIETAQIPLGAAHVTAAGIGYYMLGRKEPHSLDFHRRSLVNNLRQAAAALGYRLEPIRPVLAVDNSEITMGR